MQRVVDGFDRVRRLVLHSRKLYTREKNRASL
jgi:hypothetical protein